MFASADLHLTGNNNYSIILIREFKKVPFFFEILINDKLIQQELMGSSSKTNKIDNNIQVNELLFYFSNMTHINKIIFIMSLYFNTIQNDIFIYIIIFQKYLTHFHLFFRCLIYLKLYLIISIYIKHYLTIFNTKNGIFSANY